MKNLQRNISSFLKYFSVILLLQKTGVVAAGCKTMKLLQKKPSSYLRNHVIQNLTVSSESMCRVMCYLNDSCLSYNFHEGTGKCEINNSDELQHPDDLISNPDYLYRGTKNDCHDHTCPSNSTCQAIFTHEGGYHCICPSGFTGKNCEADIDECTTETDNCVHETKCENSIGSFHCIPLGGSKINPARSCLHILESGHSNGSAEYWLDPDKSGNTMKVLCDMTTDGGGWTVVKKLVQPSNTALPKLPTNTYDVIKEYNRTDVNVIPISAAMLDLKNKMGFHQIHFYCHKVSVGRVVSIMTKNNTAGLDVVSFFTNPFVAFPAACGSFDRLPDDTSIISQNCDKWGGDPPTQTWGGSCCPGPVRMAARPFIIDTAPSRGFEFHEFFLCDNEMPSGIPDAVPPDVNDTWQISVR